MFTIFSKIFRKHRLHGCDFFHVCCANISFYLNTNNRHTFTTYDPTLSTQPSLLTQFRYLFGQKTPVSQHSLWQLLLIISGLVFILYFLSTDSGVNTKLGKKKPAAFGHSGYEIPKHILPVPQFSCQLFIINNLRIFVLFWLYKHQFKSSIYALKGCIDRPNPQMYP